MDDYIAREAFRREIAEYRPGRSYEDAWALSILDSTPSADVRPVVHGHWVYEEPNGANSFKGAYWCDQCHQPESYRKNFCPNCGADMREATSAQQVHTDECREKKITYVDTSEDLIKSLRVCGKTLEAAVFPEWDICLYTRAANAIEERERLIDAQLSIIKQYQEYLKKDWIPMTEQLPKLNVSCLVYNKYYGPMVGCRIDDSRFRIPGSCFPDHPTHWMPLPEPPKEET